VVLTTPTSPLSLQYSFVFTGETIFLSGSSQRFRLRAQNGVGLGAFSEERIAVADSVPTFMNSPNPVPLEDIAPFSIKLTWDGISLDEETGRDPVIYYELQWFNYETETWDIITTPTSPPSLLYEFTFAREIIFPSGSE
jgi:hypothetical protein